MLWVIAIGLVVGIYGQLTTYLKDSVESSLSHTWGCKVTLQGCQWIFPSEMRLTGVTISAEPGQGGGPLLSIGELKASFNLLMFLSGQPGIVLEVTAPRFLLKRGPEGSLHLPLTGFRTSPSPKRRMIGLSRLRIREGELTFLDQMVSPQVTWEFRDLRLSVKSGPLLSGYSFSAMGVLVDSSLQPIGKFEASGELSFHQTAHAQVRMVHQELSQLGPYVRRALGTAPSSGSFQLESTVTLNQGMMVAQAQLTATQVAFATDEPTVLGPPGNRLVELLEDSQKQIHLNFVVKGRLGEKLDWSDLMSSALREAMRQALARSLKGILSDSGQMRPVEELIRKGLESLGR